MIFNAYSIYDTKLQTFGAPFFAGGDQIIFRHMSRLVNSRDEDFAVFHSDFQLFKIGSFDTETGGFFPSDHVGYGPLTQFKDDVK